jgi:hypothetical protein
VNNTSFISQEHASKRDAKVDAAMQAFSALHLDGDDSADD